MVGCPILGSNHRINTNQEPGFGMVPPWYADGCTTSLASNPCHWMGPRAQLIGCSENGSGQLCVKIGGVLYKQTVWGYKNHKQMDCWWIPSFFRMQPRCLAGLCTHLKEVERDILQGMLGMSSRIEIPNGQSMRPFRTGTHSSPEPTHLRNPLISLQRRSACLLKLS